MTLGAGAEGTSPWLRRRVLDFAHQGGAREGPSSTLHAMRGAIAHGATAIELDVHATSDGHLVVSHDATVDRMTDGKGRIADLTLDELKRLDAAYWYVPGEIAAVGREPEEYLLRGRAADDTELRIATLREVLEALPGVFLNLDIKQTAPAVTPYEESLARLLKEFERADDVIVASFHDSATRAFSAFAPGISTSPGTTGAAAIVTALRKGTEPPGGHHALQVPVRFGPTTVVDEETVAAAHDHGMAVHVWTIDDPAEMARLVDLGVDGIMSDRPSVLGGVLNDRGVAYRPRRRRQP